MTSYYICDQEFFEEQMKSIKQEQLCLAQIIDKPQSLFKYFPNTIDGKGDNHSIEMLKNNMIHLSNPSDFDDPYDSNAFIDFQKFKKAKIEHYLSLCGLLFDVSEDYDYLLERLADKVHEHISQGKNIELLLRQGKNEHEKLDRKELILAMDIMLKKGRLDASIIRRVIEIILNKEYERVKSMLKQFRISCFSENPYLMLMWAHYADNHKGFCVEYEVPKYNKENESLMFCLYPVIYSNKRVELTSIFTSWGVNGGITIEDMSDIYKYGLLSKSIDWKYQKEWRLITLDDIVDVDENNNCEFFRIKKVYLGNKMQPKERKEIIQICKEKNIPYIGVTISDDKYEMKDCDILCEDCFRMK